MKIAYNAGHILATAGKRLPKALDPNETREWTLNDRVARYFAAEMAAYEGVDLRRMDDPNGIEPIDIDERVAMANEWGADFYLSIHHNAAGVIFSGGGACVYIDATGGPSERYAWSIYNALIEATGLKGNRSDPLISGDESPLYEPRATKMPAVLVEYGFMDSVVDAPIILTEDFARKAGIATARAIAAEAGLTRKEGFCDVPENAWYAAAVNWGIEYGVVNGLDCYHFGPDEVCTRAQAVTMLWRLYGSPEPEGVYIPFADVHPTAFYATAIQWAVDKGITKGTGEKTFSPDDPCTRGQIVTFLWRAEGSPAAIHYAEPFEDVTDENYFAGAVAWAVAEGITNGVSSDRFAPSEPCTRAQLVTFLYRLDKN